MALVPCRDCGETVSDHAEMCPKCGRAYPGSKGREQTMLMWAFIFLAVMLSLTVWIA